MIHIVFEAANVKVLQSAMELDESLQGEVLEIKTILPWGLLKIFMQLKVISKEETGGKKCWPFLLTKTNWILLMIK